MKLNWIFQLGDGFLTEKEKIKTFMRWDGGGEGEIWINFGTTHCC